MKKIQITPAWRFHNENGEELNPALFSLLSAIHQHGNLSEACREIGISYRHGWNLLQRWGQFFGSDLVTKQRGKGALLTQLGEKLIWAQQRINARLRPQLDSLASELSIELNRELNKQNPLLKLYASHGYAVALLPEAIKSLQVNMQYTTGLLATRALLNMECDLAGIHLPSHPEHWPTISRKMMRQLENKKIHVIPLAERQQGLMVKQGNPLHIQGLSDLSGSGIRFINRQKDSGTRALLDHLLKMNKTDSRQIHGYQTEEYTHSAVAAYVASGMADAGFGVEAAARQFGLDFIPVSREKYLFVCHSHFIRQPAAQAFVDELTNTDTVSRINQLPGYQCISSEQIEPLETFLGQFQPQATHL